MDEYSITSFLKALAEDDLDKKIIELISKGHIDEDLLVRILNLTGSADTNNNI